MKSDVTAFANKSALAFTISLPAGGNYKAVIWAQSSKCEAYSISDDMVVTVDYEGVNNEELRDAFWGVSEPFTVNKEGVEVVLKRPFAQVNVGAYPFDWEYVKDFYKFDATQSSTVIRGVANELNLLDGSVAGEVDVYFKPTTIPAETLYADVDRNNVDEEYVYLSMSYVLADTEPTTHSMSVFFLNDDNQAVVMADPKLDAITIQRNHRNDFIGQVISDNGELNIREYVDKGNGAHPNEDVANYLYYRVTEPTTIANTLYNFSDNTAGLQFASDNGQMMTLENLYFTGTIWVIEFGEYRGGGYVNYNNTVNNVEFHNLAVSACIECHEWYFAPAVIAYGNTVLTNCKMKGTTNLRKTITDKHGVTHNIIPVDLGIRNESDGVIQGGEYGTVFAWTHAVVDIHDAVIDKLYCGTCDSTKHSWMTIHSGTKIDQIICCEPRCPYGGKEYSTTMTIKSGAVVGSIDLVSTDVEFLIIEEGAKVGKITCQGVEYTYKELREAMGLN